MVLSSTVLKVHTALSVNKELRCKSRSLSDVYRKGKHIDYGVE